MMRNSLVISLVGLFCIVGCLLAYVHVVQQTMESRGTLRLALVKSQAIKQRVHRLEDEVSNPLLQLVGKDISSLQVRLAEFVSRYSGADGQIVDYEQKLLPQTVLFAGFSGDSSGGNSAVQILRLTLELQVPHAPALLGWIERILSSSGGWPAEIRACDIHKNTQPALVARCVVDVYHWQGELDE